MPHRFQVAIKGLIEQDDKILLLKFPSGGIIKWDLPGGRIDNNENFIQAFTRELAEEMPGVTDIKLGELIHAERAKNNFDDDSGLGWLFYTFTAQINHWQLSEEHSGYAWVSRQELEQLNQQTAIHMNPKFYRAINKYFTHSLLHAK